MNEHKINLSLHHSPSFLPVPDTTLDLSKSDFCWQGHRSIYVNIHWNQECFWASDGHCAAPGSKTSGFSSCPAINFLCECCLRSKPQKILRCFIHVSDVRAISWNASFTAFLFPLMSSSPSSFWGFTVKQVTELIWFEYLSLAGRRGA